MSERYRTIVADPPWDHSEGKALDTIQAEHRRLATAEAPFPIGLPARAIETTGTREV